MNIYIKDWEGNSHCLLEVLSQNVPGETQEDQETPQPGKPVLWHLQNKRLQSYHETNLFGAAILPHNDV
jgi:hypothetical protein